MSDLTAELDEDLRAYVTEDLTREDAVYLLQLQMSRDIATLQKKTESLLAQVPLRRPSDALPRLRFTQRSAGSS